MKKFKIISTCTSLVLMLALLAFGVYAANIVTFSISSTVSFAVQDVYIKVAAGLGSEVPNPEDLIFYYSQPEADQKNISQLTSLGNDNFVDEDENSNKKNTISYYLYIENLHSMAINLKLEYSWQGSSKYNAQDTALDGAVAVTTVSSSSTNNDNLTFGGQTKTPTVDDGVRTDLISSSTDNLVFVANEAKTLIVTLTMKDEAMVYKLVNGNFNLKVKASLDVISTM